jgi:hypothetical protein
MGQDIAYGFRVLARKPGFAVAAILSLALGIGANTTIFSIVNGTILSSLPYRQPRRLAILWSIPLNRPDTRGAVTAQNYLAWKEHAKSFSAIGGVYGLPATLGSGRDGAPAEQVERLAAIGIYGVMAYVVAQRTREIGIRMALGATSTNVLRLIIRQALLLILAGTVLGLGGAYGLTRFLQNLLWNVSPTDPVIFTIVALGSIAVSVVACLAPTRCAARVDPMVALRYE